MGNLRNSDGAFGELEGHVIWVGVFCKRAFRFVAGVPG